MIKIDKVSKKYGELVILDEITYVFPDTGLFLLKGFNGSGKSTLLDLISLIDNKYYGEIYIDERNFTKLSRKELDAYRLKNIAYIRPSSNFVSFLNLKENINLENGVLDDELIKDIDLSKGINEVSGGQLMLCTISKYLKSDKDIILLDEVTSELDEMHSKKVLDKLYDISKSKLVIFATHDVRILKDSRAKTILLKGGKLYDQYN